MKKAWNNQQIKKRCEVCGNEFSLSPSKSGRRFCSKSCFYVHRFKDFNISRNCSHCGTPIKTTLWKLANRKHLFCSFKCRCEAQKNRDAIPCENCGTTFFKRISQKSRTKHHFCCHKCSEEFHVGNNHMMFIGGVNYGREWRFISQLVRMRDKVCKRCSKTKEENGRELDVHHVVPFVNFGYERRMEAHRYENLITYCRSCHKVVEEGIQ